MRLCANTLSISFLPPEITSLRGEAGLFNNQICAPYHCAFEFAQRGLQQRAVKWSLTSPRRRQRGARPECFPPAPMCCTCVTTSEKGRGLQFKHDIMNSTFWKAIRPLKLQATSRTVTHGESPNPLKLCALQKVGRSAAADVLPQECCAKAARRATDCAKWCATQTNIGKEKKQPQAEATLWGAAVVASGQDGALCFTASPLTLTSETNPSILPDIPSDPAKQIRYTFRLSDSCTSTWKKTRLRDR